MNNIDQFNQITGQVLAELYEVFPRKITLSAKELGEGLNTNFHFAYDSISWLQEHGYFNSELKTYDGEFLASVLTPKGFAVLNAVPDSLEAKESYGDLLANAAKDTIVEQGKKGLGELAAKAIAYGSTLF
jgi:hypothetical protein